MTVNHFKKSPLILFCMVITALEQISILGPFWTSSSQITSAAVNSLFEHCMSTPPATFVKTARPAPWPTISFTLE